MNNIRLLKEGHLKELAWQLGQEFKRAFLTDDLARCPCKMRVRRVEYDEWSESFYPWFLFGGTGKIVTHRALMTYHESGLRPAGMVKFNEIAEVELSTDYNFKPVGEPVGYSIARGASYSIFRKD